MNILEKLGLAPKKKHGAPVIGEKRKKKEEESTIKKNTYVRALIILGFLGVLVFSLPQPSFKEPINYNIGEPWRADDLTAPFTFPIKKSEEELKKERESLKESTPPIFHVDPNAKVRIQGKLDSLFQYMKPLRRSYEQWQQASQNNDQNATKDSLQFEQLKDDAPIRLSDTNWKTFIENYQTLRGNNDTPGNNTAQQFTSVDLQNQLQELINSILNDGLIDINKNAIDHDEITVRNLRERTEQTMNLMNVRDLAEAKEYAQYRISRNYYEELAEVGTQIFNRIIQPNLIFDEQATENRLDEVVADISKTKGAVAQGQVIIRRGDIVTPEKYNMLQSLADARARRASSTERWLRYGGHVLAIIAIITIFFFYLYLYRHYIFSDNSMLLLVLIAMSIICIASSVIYGIDGISPYIVPVAIAPIILTIIFDSRVGILATVTLALLTGLINANNFEYVTATIVACTLGLFSVRDIKKRSQFFFTTPGIVFISYAIVILGFSMTSFNGWNNLGSNLLYVGINALFILFTYPMILLFEKSFNVTTDFTLIELSDTNLPLLKQLMTKAPGTFHHSLQVSNLAEAAAGAIHANGLLCRVGGLYHDIGKMENPGYFTENQTKTNEHDKLKPRMSALVIKAHVSNGVKIAEEHNLPDVVIDFIKTHHGTSLIKYFWEKAKKEADADKKEIREEDFRYDGPLPQTKETGILLLADCVEASSRAMKDPNYQKLENLIDKMIDDRVNEGQLSKTPLTFQDLRTIKETFLNILMGIYHSRVEYPEGEEEEKKKEQEEKGEQKKQQKQQEQQKEKPSEEDIPEHPESPKTPPPVDEYYNS